MADSMKLEATASDYQLLLENEHQIEYEEMEAKIHKQNMIIEILKSIDASKIANIDAESRKNIIKSLHFIHARPYLSKDMEKNPLGKQNYILVPSDSYSKPSTFFDSGLSYRLPELTYLEKKAIQTKVFEELPKNYAESLDYLRNTDKEVLDQRQIDDKLIELKDKIKTISESNKEKCAELSELLSRCVDIKLAEDKKHLIEVIYAKAVCEQQRAK